LAFGEFLGPGAQGVADPVERVVFAATMTELLLLHSAPGLLHRGQPQPDHVEGVEDRDRVGELVIDGVGVAPEGIQGGDLDPGGEVLSAGLEPTGVRGSRASRDEVEQPGLRLGPAAGTGSLGEVDHPGQPLGPLGSAAVPLASPTETLQVSTGWARRPQVIRPNDGICGQDPCALLLMPPKLKTS
jgi:hypothetical protein